MIYFFDTSALIKYYLEERGSTQIDRLIDDADEIIVSKITLIESVSVIRRYLLEKRISETAYFELKDKLLVDFQDFRQVEFDQNLIATGLKIFDTMQMKSLDLIQLASAHLYSAQLNAVVSSDEKFLKNVEILGMPTINPLHDKER